MAVKNEELNPKILESAKKEFLEKGFLGASLKNICDEAGVTTGAIYTRYKGKEDLFYDVVRPAINLFEDVIKKAFETNEKRAEENRLSDSWVEATEKTIYWIRATYEIKDVVKILISKAEGTNYSDYINDFIEENSSASYAVMKDLEDKGMIELNLTYKEYHILLSSYVNSMFDMFINDFTLDEMLEFIPKIDKFFAWDKLVKLDVL